MFGELAQLVERCDRTAEVTGSNPVFSIIFIGFQWLENLGIIPWGIQHHPLGVISSLNLPFGMILRM
jgi:hypothetical protein